MKKLCLICILLLAVILAAPAMQIVRNVAWWRVAAAREWDHSLTLTIDSSLIDGDLTNFPILINISPSSGIGNTDLEGVFTEIGTNVLKMSLQTSAGTELFVEIEKWDNANTNGQLWGKAPGILSGGDTNLTLYYDNDHADNTQYIGVVGSAPGETVWAEYIATWHISEGGVGTRFDSTSGDNDATPQNYNGDEATTGQIDGADDFDGANDYCFTANESNFDFLNTEAFSISMWFKGGNPNVRMLTKLNQAAPFIGWDLNLNASGYPTIQLINNFGGNNYIQKSETTSRADTQWHHIIMSKDTSSTAAGVHLFVDGAENASSTAKDTLSGTLANSTTVKFARRTGLAVYWDGPLDEIRVVGVARNLAWAKAVFNSEDDSLITYTVN